MIKAGASLRPDIPMAEEVDLKSIQCGFESHSGHVPLNKMVDVIKTCSWCKKPSGFQVELAAYEAWKNGALIQEAFPLLTRAEREELITGYHGKCFDEMFCMCKVDPEECEVHNP